MKHILQDLKNNIDYFLRNRLVFSRENYNEKNEDKQGVFDALNDSKKALDRESFLMKKYNLEPLKSNSTKRNYLENLYTIDVLEKYLNLNNKKSLNVLDVGCKNWFYAKGEHLFFQKRCEKLELDGIEIDSKRVYSNFYSRAEAAKFHIKGLPNTTYIEKDFLTHEEKYDFIIWFLPFVIEEPMIKWGLPLSFFKPEKMLKHACSSLKSGGEILIINQGEFEYETQKSLCKNLGIEFVELGEIKTDFEIYQKRYGIIIKN